jgi:membrane-bound metal-dependent hydrolase YbcI (DUF457 family)
MLPPGHVAAGFLVTSVLIKITQPALDTTQINSLYFLGMIFSFIPDLDMFFAFAKIRDFKISREKAYHREYIVHAPILWLIAGLGIFFFAHDLFVKYIGLLIWFGSWSHFLLDSLEEGIMWLWPMKHKLYSFRKNQVLESEDIKGDFFRYWYNFVKMYAKSGSLTFFIEVALIFISLIVIFMR